MNKTVQDMKLETEAIKKTQTEGILQMESQWKRTGATDASITNRIQEMDREQDTSVKENVKSKTFLTQHIQELWDTEKSNQRIIGIEGSEDPKLKGAVNIFNKIVEENFSKLKRYPWIYKKSTDLQIVWPEKEFLPSYNNPTTK